MKNINFKIIEFDNFRKASFQTLSLDISHPDQKDGFDLQHPGTA
ncbi:hypothetical protein [Pedobacter sp. WC2423]